MNVLEKLAWQVSQRASHTGELRYTQTGYLILQVPNALVHGQFSALNLPGIELPPSPSGRLDAHITVMRPEEVQQLGGPEKISERGKHFAYSTGSLRTATIDARKSPLAPWRDVGRIWFLSVRSTELAQLRKSYGLSPEPQVPFHITVAVRRRNVLRDGPATKTAHMQQLAAAAVEYLHGRQGGRDHGILVPAVTGGTGSDSPGSSVQVSGHAPERTTKAAGESSPARSVDVPPAAVSAHRALLEKLAKTVVYSKTLSEAVRQAVKPTEAQAEAGNYRKGHFRLAGLDISIETPRGRSRKPGWRPVAAHYGYIRRTLGKDGDHVDVFLGPNLRSERVYIVDQTKPNSGTFDEHKVLLGFDTKEQAQKAYLDSYDKGWDGLGTVTHLSMTQFKAWLRDGDQTQPMAEQTMAAKAAADDNPDREDSVLLVVRKQAAVSLVAPGVPDREDAA